MRRLFAILPVLLGLMLLLSLPQVQAQQPDSAAPSGAQAALGSAFTYQGRLSGPTGPVNGSLEWSSACIMPKARERCSARR